MLHYQTTRTPHMIYLKECVDFIMKYDCSDPLMCAWNCASSGKLSGVSYNLVPFNNYGSYYLRIKLCSGVANVQQLQRYGIVSPLTCSSKDDFQFCNQWVPNDAFIFVALPTNTTYIEVDYCQQAGNNSICYESPPPTRLYGNKLLFTSTFDVTKTSDSICYNDGNHKTLYVHQITEYLSKLLIADQCLGSFCDKRFHPHACSPKTLKQVLKRLHVSFLSF